MSKLNGSQRLPREYDHVSMTEIMRLIEEQVNLLSEGRLSARYASASSIPTTGTNARGDIVWNSAPSAGGTIGWVCVTAGTPGTWKTWGAISA